jgi:hypothetical protein
MKTLTKENAASIREMMDKNINQLDVDAARMGVKLTGDQKVLILRTLKSMVRQGADVEKLKASLRNKTNNLIHNITP